MPKQTPVVDPEWLTRKQTAELLGVSVRTISNWTKPGPNGEPAKLVCKWPGVRSPRISAASVERLMS